MNRIFIAVDLPDDARKPPEGEGFFVTNEHYEDGLTGVVIILDDILSTLRTLVAEVKAAMPHADDLIEAAELVRCRANEWQAGGFNTDDIDNAGRLLEQVAIAILPNGPQRDELLEGRTDLNQSAVTLTQKIDTEEN